MKSNQQLLTFSSSISLFPTLSLSPSLFELQTHTSSHFSKKIRYWNVRAFPLFKHEVVRAFAFSMFILDVYLPTLRLHTLLLETTTQTATA